MLSENFPEAYSTQNFFKSNMFNCGVLMKWAIKKKMHLDFSSLLHKNSIIKCVWLGTILRWVTSTINHVWLEDKTCWKDSCWFIGSLDNTYCLRCYKLCLKSFSLIISQYYSSYNANTYYKQHDQFDCQNYFIHFKIHVAFFKCVLFT